MIYIVVLSLVLPVLAKCAGEGNIRLLEDEVATALKSCTSKDYLHTEGATTKDRQRRSEKPYDDSPKIDDNMKEANQYSHERRNTSNNHIEIKGLNTTDDHYRYGNGNMSERSLTSVPNTTLTDNNYGNTISLGRAKRREPLLQKPDSDLVDSRGIPREAELWNKVQSSVTSQQSRAALQDQIRACFQELESEAEDNGCSYSNKLERCLMLRFTDRKTSQQGPIQKTEQL